jgi:hypothetical protein
VRLEKMDCSNSKDVQKCPQIRHLIQFLRGCSVDKQQVRHIIDAIWKSIPGRSERRRAEPCGQGTQVRIFA